jgi:hypothetical protein
MNNRTWIFGTIAFSLVVIILGWVLAISPKINELADNAVALSAAQQQQASARADLEALKAQYANIDVIRAQLALIQLSLPIDGDYPDLHQEVSDVCDATGVSLKGWVNNTPVFIAATTTTPVGEPDPSSTAAPVDPATPADGQPAAGGSLLAIPIDITVVNARGFAPLYNFVEKMRLSSRLLVVTGIAAEVKQVDGRPQYSMTLSVFVYSVVNPNAAPPTPTPAPTPSPTGTPTPTPTGVSTSTPVPTESATP